MKNGVVHVSIYRRVCIFIRCEVSDGCCFHLFSSWPEPLALFSLSLIQWHIRSIALTATMTNGQQFVELN